MKHFALFAVLILPYPASTFAQTGCACCTEVHSQFDFWVGDWIVSDTLGNKIGENSITKIEDNCILSEHWKGVQGGTGSSYNYYDKSDATWNQLWVDNKGNTLKLKGILESDKMILKSQLIKGKKIDGYYNKITWSKNADGTVTQLWEIFDKQDKLINIAFLGLYTRK